MTHTHAHTHPSAHLRQHAPAVVDAASKAAAEVPSLPPLNLHPPVISDRELIKSSEKRSVDSSCSLLLATMKSFGIPLTRCEMRERDSSDAGLRSKNSTTDGKQVRRKEGRTGMKRRATVASFRDEGLRGGGEANQARLLSVDLVRSNTLAERGLAERRKEWGGEGEEQEGRGLRASLLRRASPFKGSRAGQQVSLARLSWSSSFKKGVRSRATAAAAAADHSGTQGNRERERGIFSRGTQELLNSLLLLLLPPLMRRGSSRVPHSSSALNSLSSSTLREEVHSLSLVYYLSRYTDETRAPHSSIKTSDSLLHSLVPVPLLASSSLSLPLSLVLQHVSLVESPGSPSSVEERKG